MSSSSTAAGTCPPPTAIRTRSISPAIIPGAVFFDIDGVADLTTDLPHMLPTPDDFARMVGAPRHRRRHDHRRLRRARPVVGARASTGPSAPWAQRTCASSKAAARNGAPRAGRSRRATVSRPPATFTVHFDPAAVADVDQVQSHRGQRRQDHRRRPPWPALHRRSAGAPRRPARRPHAGRPQRAVRHAGRERRAQARGRASRKIFADAGVDPQKPIVTSCGSGLTAAIVALALQQIGAKDVAVYDGSWTEWGGRDDTPIATDLSATTSWFDKLTMRSTEDRCLRTSSASLSNDEVRGPSPSSAASSSPRTASALRQPPSALRGC